MKMSTALAVPVCTQYDRAVVGNSTIVCMRVESAKVAQDSVLLTRNDGK